ncbi:hypothetical protein, partial [Vibrio vulnificus]|uniref:hypothetical protein n=1 Tax=Vibrio vulnificus TaxID=672 RepID=UPI0039B54811
MDDNGPYTTHRQRQQFAEHEFTPTCSNEIWTNSRCYVGDQETSDEQLTSARTRPWLAVTEATQVLIVRIRTSGS